MPKLKAALQSQQHLAANQAAAKRARAAEEAKRASVKASLSGQKKGKQRAKRDLNGVEHQTELSGTEGQSKIGSKGKGKSREEPALLQNKKKKAIIPFDKDDSILLLGEGNFSFSLSLLLPPHNFRGTQLLSTAYDDEKTTYEKYSDARINVEKLRSGGVRVEFGVDAGALERCKAVGKGRRWSRIVFNFPHVGAGITDQDRNILTNQHMLLRFFRSAEAVLTDGPSQFPQTTSSSAPYSKFSGQKRKGKANNKRKRPTSPDSDLEDKVGGDNEIDIDIDIDDDENNHLYEPSSTSIHKGSTPPEREGTILLTLLSQPPYSLWAVPQLAVRPPPLCPGTKLPQPRYRLLRSFEFDPDVYEGYAHRRTIGFKEGLSKSGNEEIVGRKGRAKTWEFARHPRED